MKLFYWLVCAFLGFAILALAVTIFLARWIDIAAAEAVLHDPNFSVLPSYISLTLILVPLLSGLAYAGGERFAGLAFQKIMMLLQLCLWGVAAIMMLAPVIVIASLAGTYSQGLALDLARFNGLRVAGYCVTLISMAVFAICIAEAVLKRTRRAKPL